MLTHTVTVTLPEPLYEQLQAQAQTLARSLNELVTQALTRHLPPPVESDLPSALQAELTAMASLSNDALWQIARSLMNPDKVAFYDLLLERLHDQSLTVEGREMLTRLREEADALMLRKAQAYALLQSRGYQVSQPDRLTAQTS